MSIVDVNMDGNMDVNMDGNIDVNMDVNMDGNMDVNMDGNIDKKNIINSLPVEIILYIFKFMDAYTLNKLASVFKKAMSYRGIYYEIQKIKERRENENIAYWNSLYYNYFINRNVYQINEIVECDFIRHFVVNNGTIGLWVNKNTLYESYLHKLTIIEQMKFLNYGIEKPIQFLLKRHNSGKFGIVNRNYLDDAIAIFTEKMFESHLDNCLCRNIHQWCEGYYCGGCENCRIMYPTVKCTNIKKITWV